MLEQELAARDLVLLLVQEGNRLGEAKLFDVAVANAGVGEEDLLLADYLN